MKNSVSMFVLAVAVAALAAAPRALHAARASQAAPERLGTFPFAVPGLASLVAGGSLAPVSIPGVGSAKAKPLPLAGISIAWPTPRILDLRFPAQRRIMRQLLEAGFPVTPARTEDEAHELMTTIGEVFDGLTGKGGVVGILLAGLSPAAAGQDGSAQRPRENRSAAFHNKPEPSEGASLLLAMMDRVGELKDGRRLPESEKEKVLEADRIVQEVKKGHEVSPDQVNEAGIFTIMALSVIKAPELSRSIKDVIRTGLQNGTIKPNEKRKVEKELRQQAQKIVPILEEWARILRSPLPELRNKPGKETPRRIKEAVKSSSPRRFILKFDARIDKYTLWQLRDRVPGIKIDARTINLLLVRADPDALYKGLYGVHMWQILPDEPQGDEYKASPSTVRSAIKELKRLMRMDSRQGNIDPRDFRRIRIEAHIPPADPSGLERPAIIIHYPNLASLQQHQNPTSMSAPRSDIHDDFNFWGVTVIPRIIRRR